MSSALQHRGHICVVIPANGVDTSRCCSVLLHTRHSLKAVVPDCLVMPVESARMTAEKIANTRNDSVFTSEVPLF